MSRADSTAASRSLGASAAGTVGAQRGRAWPESLARELSSVDASRRRLRSNDLYASQLIPGAVEPHSMNNASFWHRQKTSVDARLLACLSRESQWRILLRNAGLRELHIPWTKAPTLRFLWQIDRHR